MRVEEVVAPFELCAFLRQEWGRGPIHIRGSDRKFDALPSMESLPRMLAGSLTEKSWVLPTTAHCNAYRVDLDGTSHLIDGVSSDSYAKLYNSGYTLCFGDVSSCDAELSELRESALSLSRFRSTAVVTCYASPPDSSGIVHFDSQHVFFIQRAGMKRWRVSREPGKRHPLRNFMYSAEAGAQMAELKSAGYDIKPPAECGHLDVTLAEGDVLYLPPGYYHVPHTTVERSFHYTLTLDPLCSWDFISASLNATLLREAEFFLEDIRALDESSLDAFIDARLDCLKRHLSNTTRDDLKALLLRRL